MIYLRTLKIALAGLLWIAPAAFAGDGVIEINQAAAEAGVVTSGDSPGFPVTINELGSYRLTGNLEPGSATAIEVTVADVTLDLNGFTIVGSGAGAGHGVVAELAVQRVTVTNGSVGSMGGRGVWLFGPGSRVRDVKAFDNGSWGIQMGEQALVENSVASGNGSGGILVSEGGIVRGSTADDNDDDGIVGGHACLIVDSTATRNGGDGISGITGCLYKGNTSRMNQDFGLRATGASGYTQNVFTANIDGDVSGGTQIGENVCNTGLVCS
jgi:hypothetical protein